MTVRARIAHQVPGRIRLRIAERRGDREFFAGLAQDLHAIDSVEAVRANPDTGSLVIEHVDSLPMLIEAMLQRGLSVERLPVEPAVSAPRRTVDAKKPLHLVSGRDINPMFMLGMVYSLLTVTQSVRGRILIPAVGCFWNAMDAFRRSGQRQG
jgi:hypothetical protein